MISWLSHPPNQRGYPSKMKLSKLPARTRRRIFKLASHHLLDVDQVISIAIDVLYAALEGAVDLGPIAKKAKPETRSDKVTAVGDLLNAALTGQPRSPSILRHKR